MLSCGVAMCLVLAEPVFAAPASKEISGKVVHVTDGDTIVIVGQDSRRLAVRIVAIDAPEKRRKSFVGQPYAQRSRENLAKQVTGRSVRLISYGNDDYGRLLARVWIDNVDAGLGQVCAGYAWVYEAFVETLSATERYAYRSCQAKARKKGRGLWREAQPVAPWAWRHSTRTAPKTQ